MRLIKKYQNGGRPGDPLKVDSLAARQGLVMQEQQLQQLAQMLDADFNRELEEKMRLRDEYGVYADDAAGLPSIDPFLALTAAGDAEAIGSGLSDMAGGDLFTGAGNVMLGAASLAIPGTLPKIKNVRGLDVTLRDVNMPAHRGNVADITVGDQELASMSRNEDVLVQGRPMYEPDINSGASKLAESKERLAYLKKNDPTSSEIPTLERSIINRLGNYPEEVADMSAGSIRRAMADATKEMLDHVPIGAKTGATSYSTDSYPIVLQRWAKGQLSANRFDDVSRFESDLLNQSGKKYRNSPEVEQWHKRYEGNEEVVGYTDTDDFFDNTFAPRNQMDFDQFTRIDPAAKAAVEGNNLNRAEDLYDKYRAQADNPFGVSSFGTSGSEAILDFNEAQELADIFNKRIRAAADRRPSKQANMLKRGDNKAKAQIGKDEGIPLAKVVNRGEGFTIVYPQIPFHRNFEEGGKFKIKRKRPTGMQVKR